MLNRETVLDFLLFPYLRHVDLKLHIDPSWTLPIPIIEIPLTLYLAYMIQLELDAAVITFQSISQGAEPSSRSAPYYQRGSSVM
jgi:hypothetical protein